MEDLGPDLWKYNDRTQSVTGKNSGSFVRLGQSLQARITSVNIPARQLNLIPVEPLVSKRITPTKARTKLKRKFPKKHKR